MLSDERLRLLVKDISVIRGSKCETDHFLVLLTVTLGNNGHQRKRSERNWTKSTTMKENRTMNSILYEKNIRLICQQDE